MKKITIFSSWHNDAKSDFVFLNRKIGTENKVFYLEAPLRNLKKVPFWKKLGLNLVKREAEVVPVGSSKEPDVIPHAVDEKTGLMQHVQEIHQAREEYWARVISKHKTDKERVMVCGNLHADSLGLILQEKGFEVEIVEKPFRKTIHRRKPLREIKIEIPTVSWFKPGQDLSIIEKVFHFPREFTLEQRRTVEKHFQKFKQTPENSHPTITYENHKQFLKTLRERALDRIKAWGRKRKIVAPRRK